MYSKCVGCLLSGTPHRYSYSMRMLSKFDLKINFIYLKKKSLHHSNTHTHFHMIPLQATTSKCRPGGSNSTLGAQRLTSSPLPKVDLRNIILVKLLGGGGLSLPLFRRP